MGTPLSRVLHDFGALPAPPPAPADRAAMTSEPCEPAADPIEARIEEAYAKGAADGRAAANAEREQALAELRTLAAEEREAERQRWVEEQAERLADGMAEALRSLEDRISDSVARVLAPVLTEGVRDRMVQALAENVETLVSSGRHTRLHISGPEDLLQRLHEKLGAAPIAAEWVSNGNPEVRIVADDSLIDSDIQSWIERFSGGET